MTKARLDAHQNFWAFTGDRSTTNGNPILNQDYLPSHIEPSLIENGFHGGIAVQCQHALQENEYLLSLMSENPLVKAVIGWVDLTADNLLAQLSKYQGLISGFHHALEQEPTAFMLSTDFQRGLRMLQDFGYTFDLSVSGEHLAECIQLVDKFPEQPFVLDHMGRPDFTNECFPGWSDTIRKLAERPNVYCKLSGLVVESSAGEWDEDALEIDSLLPFVDCLLESFSADRLMFASNWPSTTLMATFDELCDITTVCIDQLSQDEQASIMGNTAARFYGITGLS